MTHHLTHKQLSAMKVARNWFIAIIIGLAFCYSTSSDQCLAELDKAAAYEAQQEAEQAAAVDAKARQIAQSIMEKQHTNKDEFNTRSPAIPATPAIH